MPDARLSDLMYFFCLQTARFKSLMTVSPNVTCNLGAHIDEASFAGYPSCFLVA
jgi:hypothetical protein